LWIGVDRDKATAAGLQCSTAPPTTGQTSLTDRQSHKRLLQHL